MSACQWPLMPPFNQAQESGALSMREASELEDLWMEAPVGQMMRVPEPMQCAASRLVFFQMQVENVLQ